MRSRSPSRRSTPPPPRISRRSPGAFRPRGKSPERRRRMAPPGGVPKGAYVQAHMIRPRRSRSPVPRESKARSFSPAKRKLSPKRDRERMRQRDPERERMRTREPERERGRSRERPSLREREPSHMDLVPPAKRTRSKSPDGPMGSRMSSYAGSVCGPSEMSPARNYQGPPGPYPQGPGSDRVESNRNVVSLSERFHSSGPPGSYKKESEQPVFRGPEGSGFDLSDLKKITMVIRRNPPVEMVPIERNILNPEDVVLKRRPEMLPDDREYGTMLREGSSRGFYESEASANSRAAWERDTNHYVHAVNKREGSRPIFQREEIMRTTRMDSVPPVEEHRRVVAIVDEAPPVQSQGGSSRFESPTRYSDVKHRSRDGYYPPSDQDPPPRDYPRSSRDYDRGRGPSPDFEPRERSRDDHFDKRSEDLRHELDMRRRDERYPSQEGRRYDRNMEYRGGDSDRESSHHRMMDMDRDRDQDRPPRGMMQPSPPGSERRRGNGFGRPMNDGKMHRSRMSHDGPGSQYHDEPHERFDGPPGFPNPQSGRFHYKNWNANPEHVPKGRGYFEHDNREFIPMRGRGRGIFRGNIMRGRGNMRGRPYRGGPRGFMGRGRRGIYVPRVATRRRSSPHWEHDLFDNLSADDGGQLSDNGLGK